MPQTLPTFVPADASLYLFTYAKSPLPLAARLAEMASRASVRYGPDAPTLVVPEAELAAYAASQDDQEAVYHLLPSIHLGTDQIGVLIPAAR